MMRVMLVELSAMTTARPYGEAVRHVADTVWDEAIQGEGYTARVEGGMVRGQDGTMPSGRIPTAEAHTVRGHRAGESVRCVDT